MEEIPPSDDWVAAIVRRWSELRPDLDPTPMLVLGRIARLAVLVDDLLRPPFARLGLANGDFDLLAALRRQGPPFETSPGALADAMLVTSGATSKRIDRLERQGYVTRRRTDTDGRRHVVALTGRGRALVDQMFAVHLANEAALLAPLDAPTRHELARLLGQLAGVVEAAQPTRPAVAGSTVLEARQPPARPPRC